MPQIGKVTLGVKPTICAVLQQAPNASAFKILKKSGIQLVELRIDRFNPSRAESILKALKALKKSGFSVIGTIRIKKEGGHFSGSEKDRLELFEKIIKSVDAVDVELGSPICRSVARLAKRNRKAVVVSFHDFKKTPSNQNLRSVLKKSKSAGADIIKIAAAAETREDFTRMMDFLAENRGKNLIVISMGKIGSASRLVFPFLGSLLSYGFIGKSSAPGQFPAADLARALAPVPA